MRQLGVGSKRKLDRERTQANQPVPLYCCPLRIRANPKGLGWAANGDRGALDTSQDKEGIGCYRKVFYSWSHSGQFSLRRRKYAAKIIRPSCTVTLTRS